MTHSPDFVRTLVKCVIVGVGTALFIAVSLYRIKKMEEGDNSLSRYRKARRDAEWLRQYQASHEKHLAESEAARLLREEDEHEAGDGAGWRNTDEGDEVEAA